MTFGKNQKFEFIYNGKRFIISCVYKGNEFGAIPIFHCSDIDTLLIIRTANNELFAVLNEIYKNSVENIEIQILHTLVKIYTEGNIRLADLYVAYWEGFNKMIKTIEDENSVDKKERIHRLESAIGLKVKFNIPSREEVVNSFNYIKVGG